MANPFLQHETYDETIVDPRDGEEWTVTLRVLNAGDDAAIRDETTVTGDDDGEGRMRIPMGTLRMLTVDRAVVSWTLPLPKSRSALEVLHDGIFDQIYDKVRFGAKPKEADADPPTAAPTESPSPEPTAAADS